MKRFSLIILLAMVLFMSFSLFGCSKAIVSINGTTISEEELNRYMGIMKTQYPEGVMEEGTKQYEAVRANILDSLIVIKVLEQYAAENGLEVTSEEVEEEYQTMVGAYQSEEQLEQDLETQNIDKNTLKEELRSRILRDRLYEQVTEEIAVPEEKAIEYYEKYKESLYMDSEKVKVSHILAKFEIEEGETGPSEPARQEALDKIEDAQNRLEAGESFEEVAKDVSDDVPSAENGGDLGYITKGETVQEFEDTAFSLESGEVSDIVETIYGFHIIIVTDKQPEQVKEFDEVKEEATKAARNEVKEEVWKDFVYGLIDDAEIEYFIDIDSNLVSAQGDRQE